ncbi:low molecular weight protein tyrosine phosphatase family protein [Hymenobacter sp. CRA2]|uniref:low molecular weight protein tyrosine phosphatase family protein n=1 Tax=Hymenobacter sp. CRA2 TaxID=1955620 RepID=UPI00098F9B4C|nr:hypothetical protein [Hymenobacter sp. CRA2]OON69051.1 hypothetical protein B0919_10080 [Hymenobacter sp. CRA2]
MAEARLKVLFVCTINRMRSATAHELYRHDARFEVQSAGTAATARQVLTPELLAWADAVVVMEKAHRSAIRKQFPQVYAQKHIVCLYIPDEYDYQQPELVAMLQQRFEDVYRRGLLG